MKIAIHGKKITKNISPCLEDLFQILAEFKVEIGVSTEYRKELRNTGFDLEGISSFELGDDLREYNFILSVGGDGTMLDTVTYSGSYQIPIVGINVGRLGFLATTPRDEISRAIGDLHKGNYKIASRSLIHVDSDVALFDSFNFGLNELTIVKKETSSMIVVHTYVDGEFLNSYWADGLIVSTPTGSTGYSLSCGGPLVDPSLKNFILTPVSPHNLNVRPMIVSDESEITFKIEGRTKRFMVSLDSRSCSVNDSVEISVRKEAFDAKLVQFDGYEYFETLRNKLNWGVDARN